MEFIHITQGVSGFRGTVELLQHWIGSHGAEIIQGIQQFVEHKSNGTALWEEHEQNGVLGVGVPDGAVFHRVSLLNKEGEREWIFVVDYHPERRSRVLEVSRFKSESASKEYRGMGCVHCGVLRWVRNYETGDLQRFTDDDLDALLDGRPIVGVT